LAAGLDRLDRRRLHHDLFPAAAHASVACWLVYGIGIGSGPIAAANAVTLALALAILVLKLRYDLRQ